MAPLTIKQGAAQAWGWTRWELRRRYRVGMRRWSGHRGAWVLAVALGLVLNGLAWRWSQSRVAEQAMVEAARAMRATQAGAQTAFALEAEASARQLDRKSFDAVLVSDERGSNVLHDLLASAQAKGVDVLSGDYRTQRDTDSRFTRQHISMPVRGQARAVRGFIEENLLKHPGLAVQALQFKRGTVGEASVEARIDWVLLSRLPPDKGGTP